MNTPGSSSQRDEATRMRLYLTLSIIAALALIAAILLIFWQALRPEPEPSIRLTPAAAPVDGDTQVLVSGSDWQRNEDVAVCLTAPGPARCDPATALIVERVSREGTFEASLQVGALLSQGQTQFLAQGTQSGVTAIRVFRVLQPPGDLTTMTPSPPPQGTETPTPAVTQTATLTPSATPSIPTAFEGWEAEYYNNAQLAGSPVLVRDDANLAFNWGTGSPHPAVPSDRFSARWSRQLPFEGRRYRFSLQADDGVRFWIDGRLLIDEWHDLLLDPNYAAELDLLPGNHELLVEYYENVGEAFISLGWQVVDTFPDWRGEYFTNGDLMGAPTVIRNDSAVSFDWEGGSPVPGVVPADGFSVRWTKMETFDDGIYRFSLAADDGARLFIDNQLVLDNWSGAIGEISTLDWPLSGGSHQVRVEYHEDVGAASISFGWALAPEATATPTLTFEPTATPTEVPQATFTPTSTPSPTATPQVRAVTVTPTSGWAGTIVTVTSEGWPPGIVARVALLEPLADIAEAEDVGSGTVQADGSIEITFVYPNQDRWLELPQVQVIMHDGSWQIRGVGVFNLISP